MSIKKFFNFNSENNSAEPKKRKNFKLSNPNKSWQTYPNKYGITINIQPGFISNSKIDNNIDNYIKMISDFSKKYYLVYNQIDIYSTLSSKNLKFRISDIEGNDENEYNTPDDMMPRDIKDNIIKNIKKLFSNFYIQAEEFAERGYILFDINLSVREGSFKVRKKMHL